jgi:hypothetical protein
MFMLKCASWTYSAEGATMGRLPVKRTAALHVAFSNLNSIRLSADEHSFLDDYTRFLNVLLVKKRRGWNRGIAWN